MRPHNHMPCRPDLLVQVVLRGGGEDEGHRRSEKRARNAAHQFDTPQLSVTPAGRSDDRPAALTLIICAQSFHEVMSPFSFAEYAADAVAMITSLVLLSTSSKSITGSGTGSGSAVLAFWAGAAAAAADMVGVGVGASGLHGRS